MSFFCATDSRSRAEPPYGTASRARRWILLEHPGSWGSDALRDSGLPPLVAQRLRRWSQQLPARVLLLRRSSGRRPVGARRMLFAGVSSPSGSWLESRELGSVGDVLDLDLDALAAGGSVGGHRVTEPQYLVCTNGKHDRCCARDGLPVARELSGLLGERLWECSHVGGDRFAGNLVCLPEGHFYGHVDPGTARTIVAANEVGEIDLDHWRGRSCHPFAVQAAEALVRRRLAVSDEGALRVHSARREGAHYEVRFLRPGAEAVLARIDVVPGSRTETLTCEGARTMVPSYALVDLQDLPDGRPV